MLLSLFINPTSPSIPISFDSSLINWAILNAGIDFNFSFSLALFNFAKLGNLSNSCSSFSRTSLKRVADAKEIANTALFLSSDLSSYITGQVIRVDGGM